MSLITKEVQVKVCTKTIKENYNNLGYECVIGSIIKIKVEHLTKGSNVLVNVKCDGKSCENPFLNLIKWYDYLKCVKKDGKYYCRKCSAKLYGSENQRKTKLKNSKSFEQWCIEGNRQDVLERWDYELNDYKPSEILFSTSKKYYFKCPIRIHKSELKLIGSFTSGQEGSLDCKFCNSFAQWGIDNICSDFLEKYWDYEKNTNIKPWEISRYSSIKIWIKCQEKDYHKSYIVKCADFVRGNRCPYCFGKKTHKMDSLGFLFFEILNLWSDKNKNLPYEYLPKSKKQVWWKCPEEKHKDYKRGICDSNKYNFRCPECQYYQGEEKISQIFINNNFIKITQNEYNKLNYIDKINSKYYIPQKTFIGLLGVGNGSLSYDFYLPQYNLLIEYQGNFHDGTTSIQTKEDFKIQQEHDRRKREYAKDNNIRLLEIWYKDFDNIEQILEQYLKTLKVVV
jgi:hypothetical protein